VFASYSFHWLTDKESLGLGCAKINSLGPLFKYIHSVPYLIQMNKKPFAASLLGVEAEQISIYKMKKI
jgi:hypothetical protein